MADEPLEQELESRLDSLGYELVELERAGGKARPILRLRIDRAGSDEKVTLDDCAKVSRELESFLDQKEGLSERYVLEVSSPGVERPLVKRHDYERFAGREVAIKTGEAIGDLGKRIEGVLRGITDRDVVQLDVNGQTIEVDRDNIRKAHLVFRWNEEKQTGR